MSYSDRALFVGIAVALGFGVYMGMFLSEGNMMMDCEKDRVVAVKGLFWKPGVKYACQRIAPAVKGV